MKEDHSTPQQLKCASLHSSEPTRMRNFKPPVCKYVYTRLNTVRSPWEDGRLLIVKMDGTTMVIVWRGWGLLSVFIIGAVTVATLLGTLWVTETLQLPDWRKALDIAFSLVMAGVVNWIAGRYLNRASKSRFVPDDKTSRSSGDSAVRHDLFFIRMEYWSVPLFVIAAWLTTAAFLAR